ncbi:odorant receptor 131-2 [Larimichthys crocea]|uniref:odorant receptor 131-2 n=1 Tax=Larimichthys crocea TaxID=215358 RepID=UPI000F5D8594|nr:odorant receptor 131-2 [Larimichthys crocea]
MTTQYQTNVTLTQGLLERAIFVALTTTPCCLFLYINGTMLYTLRSKSVFRETSRYILLYNLLFADTAVIMQGQILYILAACAITLTYPVCGVLTMLSKITNEISPLTLLVMCLERYVAVCYPLRHATIITIRNTGLAIVVIWAFCSLNVLTAVFMLLNFSFEDQQNRQMKDYCRREIMFLNPVSDLYDKVYTYILFCSAGVVVSFSYIGVMVAARSATTDKASAQKASKTLLLHLVQLGLILLSALHTPLIQAISKVVDAITFDRLHIVHYVFIIILPRCLSSLIYGIRDQTIRPILMKNLCCQWQLSFSVSVVPAKAKLHR